MVNFVFVNYLLCNLFLSVDSYISRHTPFQLCVLDVCVCVCFSYSSLLFLDLCVNLFVTFIFSISCSHFSLLHFVVLALVYIPFVSNGRNKFHFLFLVAFFGRTSFDIDVSRINYDTFWDLCYSPLINVKFYTWCGNQALPLHVINLLVNAQVVELDFLYPSEGIHRRWDNGYRITSTAATWDQAALILSVPRRKPGDETQETLRTSQFPSTHVKVHQF